MSSIEYLARRYIWVVCVVFLQHGWHGVIRIGGGVLFSMHGMDLRNDMTSWAMHRVVLLSFSSSKEASQQLHLQSRIKTSQINDS
jgi:hypothetical protein